MKATAKDLPYPEHPQKNPDGENLKLFAVTQDIKPGDKCWFKLNDNQWYKDFVMNPNKTFNARLCKPSISVPSAFKVLGELSPDAIWVKDGDKIEIKTT